MLPPTEESQPKVGHAEKRAEKYKVKPTDQIGIAQATADAEPDAEPEWQLADAERVVKANDSAKLQWHEDSSSERMGPASDAQLLGTLHAARSILAEALIEKMTKGKPYNTMAVPLDTTVPLVALTASSWEDECSVHGWTHIEVRGWQGKDTRHAQEWTVRSIGIRLCDTNGQPLRMEWLLLTLLHELAHSVTTPSERRVITAAGAGATYAPVHHGADFYSTFCDWPSTLVS